MYVDSMFEKVNAVRRAARERPLTCLSNGSSWLHWQPLRCHFNFGCQQCPGNGSLLPDSTDGFVMTTSLAVRRVNVLFGGTSVRSGDYILNCSGNGCAVTHGSADADFFAGYPDGSVPVPVTLLFGS